MPIKLAHVNDIPEGKSIIVNGPNGLEIALFNVDGRIYALNNLCPHMGGPLGEGCLNHYMISCPWHGWEFDVRDGRCENMPSDNARSIPIYIENDYVYLSDRDIDIISS